MSETVSSRATVADRERALAELSRHLGTGRLALSEFDERSATVVAAVDKNQLAEVFTDLPGAAPEGVEPVRTSVPAASEASTNPIPRLVVLFGAAAAFAITLAATTGNWLWLLVVLSAPALLAVTRQPD
ncbi:DUF1707 SHOCT-like domain-containing protein [Nocardia callitridis]|uniref:DUF1707 domain-containing protein n=1 Tax=Nocardia callitridis TaxID=648753 RepID=A0ABP9KIN4_9NOCA